MPLLYNTFLQKIFELHIWLWNLISNINITDINVKGKKKTKFDISNLTSMPTKAGEMSHIFEGNCINKNPLTIDDIS